MCACVGCSYKYSSCKFRSFHYFLPLYLFNNIMLWWKIFYAKLQKSYEVNLCIFNASIRTWVYIPIYSYMYMRSVYRFSIDLFLSTIHTNTAVHIFTLPFIPYKELFYLCIYEFTIHYLSLIRVHILTQSFAYMHMVQSMLRHLNKVKVDSEKLL